MVDEMNEMVDGKLWDLFLNLQWCLLTKVAKLAPQPIQSYEMVDEIIIFTISIKYLSHNLPSQ